MSNKGVRRVFIESDQNLVDLALQETGGVDGLIGLLQLNEYSCDTVPVSGVELKVKGLVIVNESVTSFYKSKEYRVNTGINIPETEVAGITTEDGLGILTEDGQNIELE